MKLTKYHKQAIIRSIHVKLPEPKKPTKDELQAALVKAMSPPVRRLYKTHPHALRRGFVPHWKIENNYHGWDPVVGDADLEALTKPLDDANTAHHELKKKVEGAVNGCTTRKQLVDRYPEFAKFAPAEDGTGGSANLPAVADLIPDLKKAGWKV